MNLFYDSSITPPLLTLDEEESVHAVRVLRLKTGDELSLTDGKGALFRCKIEDPNPKACQIRIVSSEPIEKHPYHLHIAMAPTKNINRFEWFIEKATEVGVDEITPLICEHSERTTMNMSRLKKITISAMKQSQKCWLPQLNEPVRFPELVRRRFSGQKFIAWCGKGPVEALKNIYQARVPALILIGPEGDFSAAEIRMAVNAGFVPVSLGSSRFRTETAGIVVCCMAAF